jgi:hypothetical protein
VKRFRPAMLLLFTGLLILLVFFGAQLQVPTAFAVPGFTNQRTLPLGANTCAASGCHSGTAAAGGSVVVTGFPAGMTYTPGTVQHLSVTVTDPTQTRIGFELTARLASALQAGTFANPGAGANLGTNGVQVVQGLANSPTFTFDWTPPAAGAGTVTLYATGLAGGCCSGDGVYTNMYTLTAAAGTPPPTPAPDFSLSASPSSVAIAQGASGSSTITTNASNGFNGAVTFTASGVPSGVTAMFAGNTLTLAASSTATTGTSTVTVSGTSGVLSHTAMVNLTVSAVSSGTGTLAVSPASLAFTYRMGGRTPGSKTVAVTSASGPTSYSATETDPWLSIAPVSGSTPGNLRASINPTGMAPGTYGAQINISTPNGKTTTVPVSLTITSGSGGGGTPGSMYAQPYLSNSQSGTLAAAWVDYLGSSPNNPNDARNRGLVIATSATSPAGAMAGAVIQNVTGMNLTELSFDFRADIPCTSGSPQFLVVTMDGATHTYGGCKNSPTTPASSAPMGWTHMQFDLTQAPSTMNSQVKSISLVLQQGSSSTGSIAVIDNIQINRVPVGKGAAPTPNPRDD